MARTAVEAVNILAEIYEESFGDEMCEQYRLTWRQLRELCDARRLGDEYLAELAGQLREQGFGMALFDDSILVLKEVDCSVVRRVPGRLVEKFLVEDGEEGASREAGADDVDDE